MEKQERARLDAALQKAGVRLQRKQPGEAQVTCFINTPEKQFEIWQAGLRVKSVPIKGLFKRFFANLFGN